MDVETLSLIKDLKHRVAEGQPIVRDQSGKFYQYAKDGSLRRLTVKTSKKARRREKSRRG